MFNIPKLYYILDSHCNGGNLSLLAEDGIKSSIFDTRLVCYALVLLVWVQKHQPEDKRRSFLKFYA